MTKNRKFRLATVLKVAKRAEEAQQVKTGEAARAEEAAQQEVAARAEHYGQRDQFGGPTDSAVFQAQIITNQLRAGALHVAENDALDAEERLNLAREDLLARARRTRTLEDLEERHNVAYAVSAARAAQRALDDLVRSRRSM